MTSGRFVSWVTTRSRLRLYSALFRQVGLAIDEPGSDIWQAVEFRHSEITIYILNEKPNVRFPLRKDICYEAAKHEYEGIVLQMLDTGVDQNKINNEEGTPLSVAAANGTCRTGNALLDRGANVRQYDKDAFIHAARGGQIEVLDMILKHGTGKGVYSSSILCAFAGTARKGLIETAQLLLNRRLDIRSPKNTGWRYYAVWNDIETDQLDMVRWLYLNLELSPDGDTEVVEEDQLMGSRGKIPPLVHARRWGTPGVLFEAWGKIC